MFDPTQNGAQISPYNYALALENIKRQKEAATEMANTKMPTGQMVSGIYVKPTGVEYLARGLEKMLGGYQMSQAYDAERQNEVDSRKATLDAINELNGVKGKAIDMGPPTPEGEWGFGGNAPATFADKLPSLEKLAAAGPLGRSLAAKMMEKEMSGPSYDKVGNRIVRNDNGKFTEVYAAPDELTAYQKESLDLRKEQADWQRQNAEENRLLRRSLAGNAAAERRTKEDEKKQLLLDKSEIKKKEETDKKLLGYANLEAQIKEAESYLDDAPTASGVGSLIDKGANFVGYALPGAKTAAKLKTTAGWMKLNVPRFEGPQSDKDVQTYTEMTGIIGDETKPVGVRKQALNTVKTLVNQYKNNLVGAPTTSDDSEYEAWKKTQGLK